SALSTHTHTHTHTHSELSAHTHTQSSVHTQHNAPYLTYSETNNLKCIICPSNERRFLMGLIIHGSPTPCQPTQGHRHTDTAPFVVSRRLSCTVIIMNVFICKYVCGVCMCA